MDTCYWFDREAIDVWKGSCESRNGAGAVQAWSCWRAKTKDTASEQSKANENESDRYSHDTLLTFWNSLDDRFAIFTAISRPQHLHVAPTRYTFQRISTCTFPDILLREAYSAHALFWERDLCKLKSRTAARSLPVAVGKVYEDCVGKVLHSTANL